MKQFNISSILTITTGRLLTDMSNVYNILNYLTGDNLFTHQLPKASDECEPHLLERFPELKFPSLPENLSELDKGIKDSESPWNFVQLWVANMVVKYSLKREYDLEPMPSGMHKHRCPLGELRNLIEVVE